MSSADKGKAIISIAGIKLLPPIPGEINCYRGLLSSEQIGFLLALLSCGESFFWLEGLNEPYYHVRRLKDKWLALARVDEAPELENVCVGDFLRMSIDELVDMIGVKVVHVFIPPNVALELVGRIHGVSLDFSTKRQKPL